MSRIGCGMELASRGERDAARELFLQVWSDIGGEQGDPFHRCALAHSMADLQNDPEQELVWDLRALQAADQVTDERAASAGVSMPVAGFYPSLHLNVGECYRKLSRLEEARSHLRQGRATAAALGDDGYSRMVRRGLDGLAERLGPAADIQG